MTQLPPPPSFPPPSAMPQPPAAPKKKRTGLVVGAVATAAVLGGGGFVAAQWYFSSGPQPAEALPADTVAYLAFDLDPSGEQLLAAKEVVEAFPAWEEVGIDSQGDLRREVFDLAAQEADCELDYDEDIDDWLGNKIAIAALPSDGEAPAVPVMVLQVTSQGEAEKGLETLAACGGDEEDFGAYEVGEEWAVFAEDQETVERVIEDAAEGSLADDEQFQKLVDAAGGSGLATGYASPEALQLAIDAGEAFGEEMPAELDDVIDDFQGAAMRLSAEDGAIDLTVVSEGAEGVTGAVTGSAAAEALSLLPDDSTGVLGIGLDEGWTDAFTTMLEDYAGPDAAEIQAGLDQLEEQLGEDPLAVIEKALGESAALVVGQDVQSEIPEVALVVTGDGEEIEGAINKIIEAAGPSAGEFVGVSRDGDTVVVSPNEDYRKSILESDGGLDGVEGLERAVPDAGDAAMLLYVDLDSAAFEDLFGMMPSEVAENIDTLSGFGMASWTEDELGVVKIRVTVDG